MMHELVDVHLHLDLYPNPHSMMHVLEEKKVFTLAMTNAPFVFKSCHTLVSNSTLVNAALGMHPALVTDYINQLPIFKELLPLTKYVGEVGLDYTTKDDEVRKKQRKAFAFILECCANAGDKVLSIHSRRAVEEVLEMIGPKFPGKIILHWFSGSIKQLEAAQDNGCFFSINSAMASTDKGQFLIKHINPNRVLSETDGPFIYGTKNINTFSDNIMNVLNYLKSIWRIDQHEVALKIVSNFKSLFYQ